MSIGVGSLSGISLVQERPFQLTATVYIERWLIGYALKTPLLSVLLLETNWPPLIDLNKGS
jgi:hypothetical protein